MKISYYGEEESVVYKYDKIGNSIPNMHFYSLYLLSRESVFTSCYFPMCVRGGHFLYLYRIPQLTLCCISITWNCHSAGKPYTRYSFYYLYHFTPVFFCCFCILAFFRGYYLIFCAG